MKASLEHLVFYPSTTAGKYPTIVTLHGRGTDEYDLLPIVESLELNNIILVSPRAPLLINPGGLMGGFAWYETGEEGIPDAQTLQSNVDVLRRFLEEIKEAYPVNPERLILLGFSKSTVMAYATGLLDPQSFRGIAALSGYVPNKSGLTFKLEQLTHFPVFISHGEFDEVIPVKFGRESADFLKAAGAGVDYHEYSMGHEVREETLRDLGAWLRNLLP
ncbi:MAG TPA: alpha/beta hydrolase [Terriglobales bacterium]|nr:alpha/beta hydrolase [Terriglobales bacterium]